MDVEELARSMPKAKPRQRSLEEKVRVKTENTRIFASWTSFVLIGVWLLLLQASGIAFFTRGFLLSRPVFEDHSACEESPVQSGDLQSFKKGCWMNQQFDRAVIVIIDALRFDFAIPSENEEKLYHNSFPVLYEYATKYPQNSFLTKFMADPPTTTLQRLKGLTTGSLPTFIDAGSNFAGTAIEEDNWINQAYSLNKSISFVGDDTWTALFGSQFETSHPYDSLNVHDLHTVDNGVIEHLFPMLQQKPDIAIGHLLGVDHAGHRYGPNHPSMKKKLQQMDQFIRDVISKVDDKTLLVVMGDHGMDPKGDHGGDTLLELESTLWMYSKQKFFGRLPGDSYNPAQNGKYYRTVEQIDLVPTLSLLLGLPIPYNNLGFPIAEAFLGPKSDDSKRLSAANYITASQIHRYGGNFKSSAEHELWNEVQSALKSGDSEHDLIKATERYQKFSLGQYRAKWVTFDMTSMYIGVAILLTSFVVVLSFYRCLTQFQSFTVLKTLSTAGGIFTVIGYGISFITDFEPIYSSALGLSFGVLVGSLPMIGRTMSDFEMPSGWSILSVIMAVIHALSMSSNSFTVWEDRILQFLLSTFGFIIFVRSFGLETVKDRTLSMWHGGAFIVLTKLSSLSTLCREEQGESCRTTFYGDLSSSVSHPYSLIGLGFLTLALPLIIKSFYNTSASYNGSASVWLAIGLRIVMGLAAVYWVLDGIDAYHWDVDISPDILKTTKLVVARTALGAALVAANYAWWLGTLCVEVDVLPAADTAAKVKASILGYSNIYGSYYFLLIVNIFGASLLVNKPMGGIVLSGLLYQILTLLEIVDVHKLQQQPIVSVMLCILGCSYFFSTGHHATLPAIQWEIGFIPVSTITFPFTHLAIALNTFAPMVLTILSVPLAVLWKIQPTKQPINLHGLAVKGILTAMLYHTVISTSSVLFTLQFRRHLMLWKIFAPRFMLAGIQLVAVDLVATIAIATSGKCISYVHSVFG